MFINIGYQFKQLSDQYANKVALVNVEKNRSFTYKELHLLTNKTSNLMRDHFNLTRDDVFATLLENDNNSLFNIWIMKALPSALWLNYRDSIEEHVYQMTNVNTKLVFIEKEMLERDGYYDELRANSIDIITMDKPDEELEGVYYFWDLIEEASDEETNVQVNFDDDTVLYRYTGGTTGRGKCAQYTLRNLYTATHQTYSIAEKIFDNDTSFLHIAPLSHASSMFMLPIYFNGGKHYTMNMPDLVKFCEVIEQEKITMSFAVPTILYHLVDSGLEAKFNLDSLETIFYGASPMSPAKLTTLQERFGNIFVQGYGSTEAFPSIVALTKKDHIIENEEDEKRLRSIGRPLMGVEMKIMDDDGNELPDNTIGEIYIRSGSVISGYYNDPEETKKGFTDDGFWISGDMAYRDEKGYIYIVDRKKDMIISGGFNVYAVEVENAINSHPSIQQSVVIGIPHEHWGEAVHGEVVLREGETVSEEDLIDFLKGKLGKYKVPKSITFVQELPLTAVGKVLRRKVREKYWENKDKFVN